ncbi:uncharacterized protein STAUR_1322 [Stigmatella aurantiaca DW4/3-1]|uniref:Uncharacterized protein n=1 Tax=Stigmatella aurantiaca (strain DW4/3-1) TaxID=378806 RepID=E3FJ31_STIAD|nr:uncharacterized protein STAUR_1322 [Stigmatella aurantiaca DW4/3-1]
MFSVSSLAGLCEGFECVNDIAPDDVQRLRGQSTRPLRRDARRALFATAHLSPLWPRSSPVLPWPVIRVVNPAVPHETSCQPARCAPSSRRGSTIVSGTGGP